MSSPSLLLSPPLEPSRAPTSSSTWFPYGEGTAFHGRFATIIIVVLCLLVVALSILTIVHTFRSRAVGAPRRPPSSPSKQVPSLPALDFPVGVRLVGTEVECAICLSEFVSGEKVAVLPRCNHGFHVSCIERWFASCSTCPTCRTTFYSPPPPPEKNLSSPQPELPV